MIIRDDQFKAISEARSGKFANTEAARLRQVFPDLLKGISDGELLSWVEKRLEESASYKLAAGSESGTFLELCVCYEELGDSRPAWVNDLLSHPGIAPDAKMAILQHRLMFAEAAK